MKPTAVALFANLAAAQSTYDDPLLKDCPDCKSTWDQFEECVELTDLAEHKVCICERATPKLFECIECGTEANESSEDESYWAQQEVLASLQSSIICAPTASISYDDFMSAFNDGAYSSEWDALTATRSMPDGYISTDSDYVTPAPWTPTPSPTPTGDAGDDGGDGDDIENVSTGAAPAITQAPLMLAAAGLALAAL